LQIASAERQFRYSKVFDQTADVIVTTYKKLVDMNYANEAYALFFAGADQSRKEELAKDLSEKWVEFLKFWEHNKIYIPKPTPENVTQFGRALSEYYAKYSTLMAMEKAKLHHTQPSLVEKYSQETEELRKKLPIMLTELEDEFQRILGLSADVKKNP
jgi:hypothetical protein